MLGMPRAARVCVCEWRSQTAKAIFVRGVGIASSAKPQVHSRSRGGLKTNLFASSKTTTQRQFHAGPVSAPHKTPSGLRKRRD